MPREADPLVGLLNRQKPFDSVTGCKMENGIIKVGDLWVWHTTSSGQRRSENTWLAIVCDISHSQFIVRWLNNPYVKFNQVDDYLLENLSSWLYSGDCEIIAA